MPHCRVERSLLVQASTLNLLPQSSLVAASELAPAGIEYER